MEQNHLSPSHNPLTSLSQFRLKLDRNRAQKVRRRFRTISTNASHDGETPGISAPVAQFPQTQKRNNTAYLVGNFLNVFCVIALTVPHFFCGRDGLT